MSGTAVQPAIAELMARYLQQRTDAQEAGLISPDTTGEVVPFDAAPVQTVEPRLAWVEALAALPGTAGKQLTAPPDWPQLVAGQEPATGLAFATGNFPQLVRHVQPLLHAADLTKLRPTAGRPLALPGLLPWAAQQTEFPGALLALGALRLARQWETAAGLIAILKAAPGEWQAALANEQAAQAWHQGRAEEAASAWQAQPDSVPVLFNRGMAALFLGKPAAARKPLQQAIAKIPEDGAWHHLGQLYLALAQMRG